MATQSQLRFGKELEKVQISDIISLIQNKIDESRNLEYKQPSANLEEDCNRLAETISGFLNTDGGILIFGVSEKKDKKHRYPDNLEWCDTTKERLENLLKSRIQPWNEKTRILRIRNEKNERESVFVIEIPKSQNPPHMYNCTYYQRLNYQTEPMSHWNVFRAFQTSWIRRRELHQNVLEPLYSEIKLACERIREYKKGEDDRYRHVIVENRYLYDHIEPSLQKMIDEFFNRILELNRNLGWSETIEREIVNKELSKVFKDEEEWIEQRFREDHLFLKVKVRDPSGRISVMGPGLKRALLVRKTPASYLQSIYKDYQIIDFEPYLRTAVEKKSQKLPSTRFG